MSSSNWNRRRLVGTLAGGAALALGPRLAPATSTSRVLETAEIAGAKAVKLPDYRRLLEDKDVHAVLIGSPDHWHPKMTEDALAAGKDVYLEKPVSQTLEDGEALLKLVSASMQVGVEAARASHIANQSRFAGGAPVRFDAASGKAEKL